MLCGSQGTTHYNYGMISTNGKVNYADFKNRLLEIISNKTEPGASSKRRKN